jgi:hypothetical protein
MESRAFIVGLIVGILATVTMDVVGRRAGCNFAGGVLRDRTYATRGLEPGRDQRA